MSFCTTREKIDQLIAIFSKFSSPQEKYEKIIEMGRQLPPLTPEARLEKNLVNGCQSRLYLEAELQDNLLYFRADSDALISKGLAALLIEVYSGQPPESTLKEPPLFLNTLGLYQALSPGRSNGLVSLFKKMQEEAIKVLALQSK